MAKFIAEFPNSIEFYEANKIFIDRAFKETLVKNNINDALKFTDSILYVKSKYINTKTFDEYKKKILENVDQLIVAKAEKDKSYEAMKVYYNQYQDLQTKYDKKLGTFMKCFSMITSVYTTLYNDLLNLKTENEQTNYLNKARKDFKGLSKCHSSNPNIDLIGCIISNSEKPDGTIKLYNQKFLKKRYTSEGDLHYLLFYNNKDVSDWDVDYEELTFKNNNEVKLEAFNSKKPVLKVNFDNCEYARNCAYDASFFIDGNLVRSQIKAKNEKVYFYDFENGVNISLKNLNSKIFL
jgi:hypothetical protein